MLALTWLSALLARLCLALSLCWVQSVVARFSRCPSFLLIVRLVKLPSRQLATPSPHLRMRNNKCPARAALGANFEVSTRSPASSMHGMDTGTEVEDSDATVAPDAEEPMSDGESINSEATGEKSPSFLNTQYMPHLMNMYMYNIMRMLSCTPKTALCTTSFRAQVFGRSSGERSEEFNQPISPELPLASGICTCTCVHSLLTHWGPNVHAFWPLLSKLYSWAPRVFGRVVSAKGFQAN